MPVVLLPRLLLLLTYKSKTCPEGLPTSSITADTHPLTSLGQVFMTMFEQLSTAYRDLDDTQDMVTPAQVGAIFVDWTDPQKAM